MDRIVLICYIGGKSITLNDIKVYCGGHCEALQVKYGITFIEFKLLVATSFSLNHETLSFEYGFVGTGLKYHPLENDKDLYKLMDSGQVAAKLFVNGGTPFIRNTGHDDEESITNTSNSTHKVDKASDQMRIQDALIYCNFGGKFRFHPLRQAMCYCGTNIRIEELVIYQGTTLTNFKLLVAKLFSLDHETVTLQYRVPFQGRTYAALKDDKDVDNMIQSCIETALQVFVFGTPVDMKTSAAAKRKAYSRENELDPVGDVDKKRKRVTTTKGKAPSQAN